MGLMGFLKKYFPGKGKRSEALDVNEVEGLTKEIRETQYDLSEAVEKIAADIQEIMNTDTKYLSTVVPANNWLKMHGIPMRRTQWRRKRKHGSL